MGNVINTIAGSPLTRNKIIDALGYTPANANSIDTFVFTYGDGTTYSDVVNAINYGRAVFMYESVIDISDSTELWVLNGINNEDGYLNFVKNDGLTIYIWNVGEADFTGGIEYTESYAISSIGFVVEGSSWSEIEFIRDQGRMFALMYSEDGQPGWNYIFAVNDGWTDPFNSLTFCGIVNGMVVTAEVTPGTTKEYPVNIQITKSTIGTGSGDMLASTYDPDGSVEQAGGIAPYVSANGGKIDKIKVNGVEQTIANKEVNIQVPTELSDLTTDSTHRVVTDEEKTTWNGKADTSAIPTSISQLSTDSTHRVVTDEEKSGWNSKSEKGNAFSVTLLASAWTDSVQTVTDSRFVSEGYAYTIAPAVESFTEWAEAMIYADDVTVDGVMTFHCGTAPSENIVVYVLKVQV